MVEINVEKNVVEWLMNGVTYKEIQERFSWLSHHVTVEEIKEIEKKRFCNGNGEKGEKGEKREKGEIFKKVVSVKKAPKKGEEKEK